MATATQSKSKSATPATKAVEFHLIVNNQGMLRGRIYVPAGSTAGISRRTVTVDSERRAGGDLIVVFASSLDHYRKLLKQFPSRTRIYRMRSQELLREFTPAPLPELPADFPFPAVLPIPTEEPAAVEPIEQPEVTGQPDSLPEPKPFDQMTKAELVQVALSVGLEKSISRRTKEHILAAIQEKLNPVATAA